jgi:hypothetical protein
MLDIEFLAAAKPATRKLTLVWPTYLWVEIRKRLIEAVPIKEQRSPIAGGRASAI